MVIIFFFVINYYYIHASIPTYVVIIYSRDFYSFSNDVKSRDWNVIILNRHKGAYRLKVEYFRRRGVEEIKT